MKNYLFYISLIFIISCTKQKHEIQPSSGKTNSISVIIDDDLWNGEIGDTIRNKFAAPVIGLQQEEPIFTINQFPVKLLEGFMTNSRNIIVIKKQATSQFEIIENEFTKPQNVFHISGKSVLEILDTIDCNYNKIINKIRNTEIADFQANNKNALFDSKSLNKKFNIKIEVPENYRFVMKRSKFVWLKKEISSGSLSILVYQTPFFNIYSNKDKLNQIIKTRDSIGSIYIHGNARNTQMLTDESFPFYFSRSTIDNKTAFETRGLWQMNNDFMSGPFINYNIVDKKRNRILVFEGFCYAPSKQKRDLMFELEAIIKSVKFNN